MEHDVSFACFVDYRQFLIVNSDHAPASGGIVGILEQTHEVMSVDPKQAVDAEAVAQKGYDEVMTVKPKEVDAVTKMIEEKLKHSGSLAVGTQEMKNNFDDTADGREVDKKFIANLEENCERTTKMFQENGKYRTQELLDSIKVLNDDDALEPCKTLPGIVTFLQVAVRTEQMKSRALSMINDFRRHCKSPQLDFIALSQQGKKIGVEKLIKMIDDLAAELKKDQEDDDAEKGYCANKFDKSGDKKKVDHEPEHVPLEHQGLQEFFVAVINHAVLIARMLNPDFAAYVTKKANFDYALAMASLLIKTVPGMTISTSNGESFVHESKALMCMQTHDWT